MGVYRMRSTWLLVLLFAVWAGAEARPVRADEPDSAVTEAAGRLQSAIAMQTRTRARLEVLGGARSCTDAPFVGYRRSDVESNVVDQWYVASQLWADATLLATLAPGAAPAAWDEPAARCHLDKGFAFLDRYWDTTLGGYHPRSNQNGVVPSRDPRYADDNALAGLALLAAAATASDDGQRRRYLDAARREADFLIRSGLWDITFGGGFWWNTNMGDTPEGKPAQTNALAALFFARLYSATGLDTYREWAQRTLFWMDTFLYDPSQQLYRWSMRYLDPAHRAGPPVLSKRFFNYDQGIAIEAQLQVATLDGDPDRLLRARSIGQALHTTFWGQERGGYNLQAGVEQIYTSYATWASLGHLALFDVDGDLRWLDMARANADALEAALREADGGYAYRHYRCVDRKAPGCQTGRTPWVLDHVRDTAAQAWMQHLQTAIARRMVASPSAMSGESERRDE